jgi:excisionase family DNA binding protein
MPDLLTTTAAARELGISRSRVERLILAGRLAATRHGREWIIQPAALEVVRERRPGRPKKEECDRC